jgi:hypothetical protein
MYSLEFALSEVSGRGQLTVVIKKGAYISVSPYKYLVAGRGFEPLTFGL